MVWVLVQMSGFKYELLAVVLFVGGVLPSAAVAAPTSPIIINEVDYDQPGTTDGGEFIELKNVSQKTVDIKGYSLVLWDGANPPGQQIVELSFETSADIPPDGYFVMCAAVEISTLSSDVCNRNLLTGWKLSNDKRDGIRLMKDGVIVDSLTWVEYLEGTTEGTGPAPKDLDTKEDYSISRVPDGNDTDDNTFDFKWTCASPHRANYTYNECLCLQTTCTGGKECNPESGVCEVVVVPEDVFEDTGDPDNGGPDESVVDTGSGEDTAQPIDTAIADTTTADNAGPVDTGRQDSGPGIDAAHWADLPVVGEDLGGEDGDPDDGCSAGRHPAASWAGLFMLLLSCVSLVMVRLRRNAG